MDRHSSFFKRWFAAFNAHDLDAMCEMVDPGVEVVPPEQRDATAPGVTFHGVTGFRTLTARAFERWPGLRIEPGDPIPIANHVVVPMTMLMDRSEIRSGATVFAFEGERLKLVRAHDSVEEACDSVGHAVALSVREREVVSLLAGGLTAEEIADRLVLSVLTVRTHIRNAKEKLGARTTAQAIAIAIRDREVAV